MPEKLTRILREGQAAKAVLLLPGDAQKTLFYVNDDRKSQRGTLDVFPEVLAALIVAHDALRVLAANADKRVLADLANRNLPHDRVDATVSEALKNAGDAVEW